MATTAAAPPPSRGGLTADDLTRVDLRHLSQSELQTLSSCSRSSSSADAVSPHLDRSVFNESAGSRRQTYSRLHHHRSRLPGPHRHHPHTAPSSSDDVTHSIVHFLKHFLNGDLNPPPPPPLPPPLPEGVSAPIGELGFLGLQENLKIKRKRVRKVNHNNNNNNNDNDYSLSEKKLLENGVGIEVLQEVNGKGEVVDLGELERRGDELFGEEVRKRTAGLEREEDVLGFLSGLQGQWCSRRRKRKYVDAALLGDALPIGWKVLLGLRRRDYRVSVYCRRFVSPTGQQFVSCKEAASFLKSYFGSKEANQQSDQKTCSIQQAYVLSSGKNALPVDNTDDMAHDIVIHSTPATNASNSQVNDDCLMGIENLPEVQVKDIFECFKCNLTFDEKNLYLQHLFSFHQKTTKRYKVGTPVGEGVIIKDGKYECQFCHKVFEERRSYNGHVGIHVRNSGKHSNESALPVNVQPNAESPSQDALPSTTMKMDALIEIAQTSVLEPSTIETGEQAVTDHSMSVLRLEEARAASSDREANLSSDPVAEDLHHGDKIVTENHDMVENENAWNVNDKMDCINDFETAGPIEIEKYDNNSFDMDFGNKCMKPSDDHLEDTPGLTVGDFEDRDSSVPLIQSYQFFPTFESMSNKREHEFSLVDQKLDNVTGFEELRFDDIEPFKYGFVNEQDLSSIPGGSMNLGNNDAIEDGFASSVRFGSEEVMLNTLDSNQLTVCVWCRTEFRLEGIESETPSDSIGYMCPTCKAKISGHFGGGLSIDTHGF